MSRPKTAIRRSTRQEREGKSTQENKVWSGCTGLSSLSAICAKGRHPLHRSTVQSSGSWTVSKPEAEMEARPLIWQTRQVHIKSPRMHLHIPSNQLAVGDMTMSGWKPTISLIHPPPPHSHPPPRSYGLEQAVPLCVSTWNPAHISALALVSVNYCLRRLLVERMQEDGSMDTTLQVNMNKAPGEPSIKSYLGKIYVHLAKKMFDIRDCPPKTNFGHIFWLIPNCFITTPAT